MKINLSKAKEKQTILGFGTSACWWSQNISNKETSNYFSNELYGKENLNLNIYRYNVGGGFDSDNCRVPNPWRRCESFYVNDDNNEDEAYHGSGYDWNKDHNAYTFMKECLKKGTIDTVILFANSPHYAFTSSGQASGSIMHHTTNLPKSSYMLFVNYFLDITEHFIEDGVPVKYISPINEPQWKWGGKNVWQEGCHYEPEEVAEIFHLFAQEIENRKMDVMLYGPESGEVAGLTKEYFNLFYNDKLIMKHLGAFAIHSYHIDWDYKTRQDFYKNYVSKYKDIRFDMSEWCELPCKSDTTSIMGALNTARVISWDFSELGAESWTSWVAVNQYADRHGDGHDYSDALFSASDGFSSYTKNKRYYGLLHFSKFLPIGSKVLNYSYVSDKLNISTYLTPNNETVMVCVNEGKATDIEVSGDFKNTCIYSTTQKVNFKKDFDGIFDKKIHLKAKSVTTIKLWK